MPPRAKQSSQITLEQRITNIERLLKWLGGFSGVSLVVLLGFAYFLGGINTKVTSSEQTVTKMAADVSGKDGLTVKTALIEQRLGSIDENLKSMSLTLDAIRIQTLREQTSVDVRPVPRPTPNQ